MTAHPSTLPLLVQRWRYPTYQLPTTSTHDMAERIVEAQLVAGSDAGMTDPDIALAIVASVTHRDADRARELVDHLLDLADAVSFAEDSLSHEAWLAALDEYEDTLHVATRPAGDFDQHADRALGIVNAEIRDELAARRSR